LIDFTSNLSFNQIPKDPKVEQTKDLWRPRHSEKLSESP